MLLNLPRAHRIVTPDSSRDHDLLTFALKKRCFPICGSTLLLTSVLLLATGCYPAHHLAGQFGVENAFSVPPAPTSVTRTSAIAVAKTDLASLVSRIPISGALSPFVPKTTGPRSNGTTIFNLNDDIFRYDEPRTNTSARKDDYEALLKAAKFFSGKKFATRTFLILEGTIYLNRYMIAPGSKNDSLAIAPLNMRGGDILFTGASNFEIRGLNAKLSVKGDFNRPADTYLGTSRDGTAKMYSSGSRQITPFFFMDCSNFSMNGVELDGNVEKLTKDGSASIRVSEGGSGGIKTRGCKNYKLQNLYVHHFATDGIAVGSGFSDRIKDSSGNVLDNIIDLNGEISNVVVANNGRNALTVLQVTGLVVRSSWLVLTGYTEGTYGSHAPDAGVDVEPNSGSDTSVQFYTQTLRPGQDPLRVLTTELLDRGGILHTHNLTFDNNVIWANLGLATSVVPGTVVTGATRNVFTSDVVIKNSQILEENRTGSPGIMSLVSDGTSLISNTIKASGELNVGGVRTLVDHNTIETRAMGIISKYPGGSVTMTNNTVTRTTPMQPKESVPLLGLSMVAFTGNRINLPTYVPQYYTSSTGGKVLTAVSQILACPNVTGNTFSQTKQNAADVGPRFILRNSKSPTGDIDKVNVFPAGAIVDWKPL